MPILGKVAKVLPRLEPIHSTDTSKFPQKLWKNTLTIFILSSNIFHLFLISSLFFSILIKVTALSNSPNVPYRSNLFSYTCQNSQDKWFFKKNTGPFTYHSAANYFSSSMWCLALDCRWLSTLIALVILFSLANVPQMWHEKFLLVLLTFQIALRQKEWEKKRHKSIKLEREV